MTNEPKNTSKSKKADPVVSERVQELTWALMDEQINDDEVRLLDNLLLSDDQARETYIGCVQLHADLAQHFRQPTGQTPTRTGKSLVLGFLNEGAAGMELGAPPSEDLR